jgi:hypothetical protein
VFESDYNAETFRQNEQFQVRRKAMKPKIQYLVSVTFAVVALSLGGLSAWAQCSDPAPEKAIIGTWRGLTGEGNRILLSANSDGLTSSSVVSEVSLRLRPNVLTPGHGVWRHVGERTFEMTAYGLFYSISTGRYQGYLKAKLRLAVNETCTSMVGTDKVEIYDATGTLVFAVPESPTSYVRTLPEAFD